MVSRWVRILRDTCTINQKTAGLAIAILNRQFPHLLPDDIVVWQRFLEHFGHLYSTFDYDVRVGQGRPAPDQPMEGIRKMALDLSQRRIDAVGHQPSGPTVIEITTGIGFKAIGQIQVYPRLYRERFGISGTINTLIVGAFLQDDILGPLKQLGLPWVTIDETNVPYQSGHLIT